MFKMGLENYRRTDVVGNSLFKHKEAFCEFNDKLKLRGDFVGGGGVVIYERIIAFFCNFQNQLILALLNAVRP